jgi:[ribosomal protein S5]-alanine N-acetyltransferase
MTTIPFPHEGLQVGELLLRPPTPANTASIRVLERAGFTREGLIRSLLRHENARADAYLYSLLPGE